MIVVVAAAAQVVTVDDFFAGYEAARPIHGRVVEVLERSGLDYQQRVTRSQIALRRARPFAYLWVPGRYLRGDVAAAVLSLAFDHPVDSARFKQVVHPSPRVWLHHLELRSADEVDEQVQQWLLETAAAASVP
jgi:hypothetical protein